jgi:ABC-type nitrate/sulfonate/bicarbonate transport system substrate-binding protein
MTWNRYLAFGLAICVPLAGYSQSASTGARIDLRVITGHYHAGHRVMTKIANEKGWFREEGLGRVEITPLGTTDDRLTLAEIARGRADIVWDAHSDIVVQEDAAGAPLAVIDVFRSFQPRNLLFAGMGVSTILDLKGKRVGVNEIDGMDAWEIRKGLERAGLDPDRDVVWVPHMRGQYARGTPLEILQRRDVDAMTAFGPDVAPLRSAGFKVVADLTKVYPAGYPIRFLVARRTLVEQNPGAVEAFLRAITRAKRFAADERNAAEELALRRTLLEEDVALGGERADAARGELRTLSTSGNSNRRDYYDPKGVEFLIQEQKNLKRVSASYRGERLVHVDLLQRAVAQLDQRFGAGGYR